MASSQGSSSSQCFSPGSPEIFMRDHVQAHGAELECCDLAALADNIWRARVARKPSAVAAVTSVEDTEEGEAAVAAISARKGGQQTRNQQPMKHAKANDFRQICWKHPSMVRRPTAVWTQISAAGSHLQTRWPVGVCQHLLRPAWHTRLRAGHQHT